MILFRNTSDQEIIEFCRASSEKRIRVLASSYKDLPRRWSIRWHLQAGNICIPGSSNEQHIIEDYDVWDFELTEEEMVQMTALEREYDAGHFLRKSTVIPGDSFVIYTVLK